MMSVRRIKRSKGSEEMIFLNHTNLSCTSCGDRAENFDIKIGETRVILCKDCSWGLNEMISDELNDVD